MRQVFNFLTDVVLWLWGFLFGSILSGLVWDEINHQITYRGITQKICYLFINMASKQFKNTDDRKDYIYNAVATIEHQLSERRHLNALKHSLGPIWNQLFLYLLLLVYCLAFFFSAFKTYDFMLDWKTTAAIPFCLFHFYLVWDMFTRGSYVRLYEKLEIYTNKETNFARAFGCALAKVFLQIPLHPNLFLCSFSVLLPSNFLAINEFLLLNFLLVAIYIALSMQRSKIRNFFGH